MLKKISLIMFLCASVWILACNSNQSADQQQYSLINSAGLDAIQMNGFLGDKIDLCIQNRIKAQDVEHVIEPFRHRTEKRWWQTEFWGKWFLSAADAYRYTHDAELKAKLDEAVDGLLKTQTPDGYIGNYADDKHLLYWDIWGRKYSMLGLLSYYDLTGDKKVLKAVQHLADHLLSEVGPGNANIIKTGNYRGMASSSVPFVWGWPISTRALYSSCILRRSSVPATLRSGRSLT